MILQRQGGCLPAIILLAIPISEIAIFIKVGGYIGIMMTLLIIMVTGILGLYLMRKLGFQSIEKIRTALKEKERPERAMFDGFLILIAGVLLLVPGFLTDIIGLGLFVPIVRHWVYRWGKWGGVKTAQENVKTYKGEAIIDLEPEEYQRTDDKNKNSKWYNVDRDKDG